MKVAAIDFGTNSFLCLIANVEHGKLLSVIEDRSKVVRLGQGVHQDRKFHPDALQRAERCIAEFREMINEHKVTLVKAVATSAARDVSNADLFFDICKRYQIPVEIISGEREAEVSFRGATSGLPDIACPRLIIDVGGGSTELIKGDRSGILDGESLDIGCVRLTEMFKAHEKIDEVTLEKMIQEADRFVRPLAESLREPNMEVIAVAGTPTTLAAAEIGGWNERKVNSYTFTCERLEYWMRNLASLTSAERVARYNIDPGRADVLVAGAVLLYLTLLHLNVSQLRVSTRGVRYGLAETLA